MNMLCTFTYFKHFVWNLPISDSTVCKRKAASLPIFWAGYCDTRRQRKQYTHLVITVSWIDGGAWVGHFYCRANTDFSLDVFRGLQTWARIKYTGNSHAHDCTTTILCPSLPLQEIPSKPDLSSRQQKKKSRNKSKQDFVWKSPLNLYVSFVSKMVLQI